MAQTGRCSPRAPRSATARTASPCRGSARPGPTRGAHRHRPRRQLRPDHREPADNALSAPGPLTTPLRPPCPVDSRRMGPRERSSTRERAASARPPSPRAPRRGCAAQGMRTLVISTDPAHSLVGLARAPSSAPTPVKVGDNLWGQEVKAQEEMERHWSGVQEWLGELLIERGVDRISAEELTVPPGMDELFALLRLKRHHESGRWDVDHRRLRADRRDAAAAVVPRRRPLVDREGVPVRAPDPGGRAPARPLAARHPAAQPGGVRRHRAAVAEPDRDERDPPRPRRARRSGW